LNRLRNRLVLVFLAATLIPLGVTLWITTTLLDQSVAIAPTRELEAVSRSLEITGRALYQRARESLKDKVHAGTLTPEIYKLEDRDHWPPAVAEFDASKEPERFTPTGANGERVLYLTHKNGHIETYSQPVGGLGMQKIADHIGSATAVIESAAGRDFRRGFLYTFVLLAAVVWVIALAVLIYCAYRISRPIQQLTSGLTELAAGNLDVRLDAKGDDEVGIAMRAFNDSAEQLRQSRDRLIHLTRVASWQTLARKMAHEVKNSLTPIRLTMEELVARGSDSDPKFLEQAAQIVVDEVGTLERRVRAFSDFSAEPPVRMSPVNVNALMEERVAFLKNAHPEVIYTLRTADRHTCAMADEDLIKGVITNLLENAADAAGGGGVVLCKTFTNEGKVAIEVHDSGPGLSLHAKSSLFEPTISFKKTGMGLGLSIARRSALLSGGDISVVEGELGGAAFRVLLPAASWQLQQSAS
jgi:nitrogen fixation/metabolism regulation signal transduction histidine kinase